MSDDASVLDNNQLRILIVDDSSTDRTRTAGLLKKSHTQWHIQTAADGHEALSMVKSDSIDVVVTDLQMPKLDGRQLIAELNNLQPGLPVVLMTSMGDDQVAAECLALGATHYVPKRRLAEDLTNIVRDVAQEVRESRLTSEVLKHVVSHQLTFKIDSRLDQIRSLANLIQQRISSTGALPAERLFQVAGAVREALLNAHFHGNLETNRFPMELSRNEYRVIAKDRLQDTQLADRQIRLTMKLTSHDLEVDVTDDGPGFDMTRLPSLDEDPVDEFPNGNGIRTMRKVMDQVIFHEPGNHVTLKISY